MKPKKKVVKVKEDETNTVELELDKPFIDFYRKETGRIIVTQRGLTNFINRMISAHRNLHLL